MAEKELNKTKVLGTEHEFNFKGEDLDIILEYFRRYLPKYYNNTMKMKIKIKIDKIKK